MKNHLRMALAALLLFMGGSIAFAQQKISGTIVDLSGQPVIGASVMIPGTTTGAVTNLDGKYELSVPAGSNLTVSCIGYVDQTFTVVAGKNVYDFTLSDDAEMLEETVVIGYGSVKVKDLTGSVAAVGSKDLEIPVSNVAEALQGKMAGVVVSVGSQSPGSAPTIRVRGSKSISRSNDPLILVDGFPVSSLTDIPADQIKSINVLKDAASTAIYGSRGAAGVILVTTKSAIEGQTTVSYNGYVQVRDSSTQIYDVLDAEDYLKFTLGYARDYSLSDYTDMLKFFGIGANYGNTFSRYAGQPSHNWQEDLLKTAVSHSHNLSVSTGTSRNRTMFNVNYMYDDGTVINSWFRRINASIESTQKLTSNLDLDLNISYNNSTSQGNSRQGNAYQYRPVEPLGPEPNNYNGFGNGLSYVNTANNPVELTYNEEPANISHNFRGIGAINWRPVEGLTLRTELGLNKGFGRTETFNKGYGNETRSASLRRSESSRLNWTTTAQYQIPFKSQNHRADIMVGNEIRTSNGSNLYFYGYEYPENFDRERTFAFLNQYTKDFTFSTGYNTPGRVVSFFSRANYTLMDKYLFTLTFRADGSSNFAPNNRWGYFPSAAFAWRVIDEPFMADTHSWLSNLKLRLSYGISGSDNIDANLWRETWSLSGNTNSTVSTTRDNTENDYGQAYYPGSQMQNPSLRWEATSTANLGIDFGFLKERIYGSIEGYWMVTDGLLMSTPVNGASGYSTQYQNLGTISNKGIELTVGGDIVRNHDFTLRANLVFQYNANRVEYIDPAVTSTHFGSWANSEHRPNNPAEIFIEEGKPMGMVTAYAYDGWYTVDDFDYDPATGVYTLKEGIPDWAEDSYWTSFNRPAGQTAFPGALKLKDLHGAADGGPDGKITNLDSYTFGCMVPPASGSFALSGRWKNLDFNAAFNYVLGGYIMNVPALTNLYGSKNNRFGANRLAFVKDAYSPYRWNNGELEFVSDPTELSKMNANAKYWTPTSMVGMLVDKYLEPASFLRLKNLTIGYTIPSNISQKIGMKNLRAYVTATNLFTLTKYTGLNPEVNISSSTTPGVDNGNYPMARTYTFGLNITF